MIKTNEEALKDAERLDKQLEKTFPDWTWEDRAMWTQTPQEILFGSTPLSICATDDISPLIKWLKDREPNI